MTSDIRVGRESPRYTPKIRRYRVGQGRSKMAKKRGTSLMDVPSARFAISLNLQTNSNYRHFLKSKLIFMKNKAKLDDVKKVIDLIDEL